MHARKSKAEHHHEGAKGKWEMVGSLNYGIQRD